MRVLIVEDDLELLAALARRVAGLGIELHCVAVSNAKDAQAALAGDHFDLVLADLQIPSSHSSHDADITIGETLIRQVAQAFPGTFIVLYSGLSEASITDPLYEQLNKHRPNVFGQVEGAMFTSRPKVRPEKAIEDIASIHARQRALKRSIPFENYEVEALLDPRDAQLLRAFGASRGATVLRAGQVGNGKSGARVYTVTYYDSEGKDMLYVVAKVDHWASVSEEERNYESYVAGMLELGTYAPLLNRSPFLCGELAAMFYQEIRPSKGNLSTFWLADADSVGSVIVHVRAIEARWQELASTASISIEAIRGSLLSDQDMSRVSSLVGFDVPSLENREVRARICLQHGDLHAGNVLVTDAGRPYYLDFASIQRMLALADPITLELSYVFNNPGRAQGDWPTVEAIRRWHIEDEYFFECPARHFLSMCRSWAREAIRGLPPVAMYAFAYAYSMRQLKYTDVERELAVALATAMNELISAS